MPVKKPVKTPIRKPSILLENSNFSQTEVVDATGESVTVRFRCLRFGGFPNPEMGITGTGSQVKGYPPQALP